MRGVAFIMANREGGTTASSTFVPGGVMGTSASSVGKTAAFLRVATGGTMIPISSLVVAFRHERRFLF